MTAARPSYRGLRSSGCSRRFGSWGSGWRAEADPTAKPAALAARGKMQRGAGGSNSGAMMQTYAVTVPPGVGPGQQFQASLDGQLTMVIVPHGSGPNSTLHVQIPVRPCSVQKYAITIPAGVQPGGRFQANLGGQLVWLNCPRSLGPGKQMLVDASSAGVNQPKTWPPPIGMPEGIDGAPRRPTPPPTPPRAPEPRSCTPLRPPCGRRSDPHPRPPRPRAQARKCRSTSSARSPAASCASPP